MPLQYTTSLRHWTSTLPKWMTPAAHSISFGFWVKKIVDRPIDWEVEELDDPYQYKPLSSPHNIRLLKLEPGKFHQPLCGSLVEVKGDPKSKDSPTYGSNNYEALSYVWGDHSDRTTFSLDGCEFSLTKNLGIALRHLRSTTRTIKLWIDQMCINQQDDLERSEQVAIMLDIYSSADCVHAWLGASTSESVVGMKTLKYLFCDEAKGPPPWLSLPPQMVQGGLSDIIQRQWFQRVWIVQETAVARKVVMHCGTDEVSWSNTISKVESVIRAIKVAALSPQWIRTELKSVSMDTLLQVLTMQLEAGPQKLEYRSARRDPSLIDVAYDMRNRKAADPRDQFIAMLGLIDQQTWQELSLDYSKSFEEVYDRVLRAIYNLRGPVRSGTMANKGRPVRQDEVKLASTRVVTGKKRKARKAIGKDDEGSRHNVRYGGTKYRSARKRVNRNGKRTTKLI